ncbi:MAG: TetR/AcrR family transcriptional regulator [Myxococcota bacterium]
MRLFLERGIEGVSIDDLTSAAKMAKGGFYRYFADKEALVAALLEPAKREMEGAFARCGEGLATAKGREEMFAAYREVGAALAVLVLEHPDVLRLYLQECRGPAVGARRPVRALAAKVALEAVALTQVVHARKLFRPIHPAVSALAVVGASERLLLAVLAEEEVGNPLQIPEALIGIILEGIRARER